VIKHADFETGADNHKTWYGCTIARSGTNPIAGSWSLEVNAEGAFWGADLDNYPGFSGVVAGQDYECSVSYVEVAGTTPTVAWGLEWNAGGAVVRTDTVLMPRSVSVATVTQTFTAPATATHVRWFFNTETAPTGSAIRLDSVIVQTPPTGRTGTGSAASAPATLSGSAAVAVVGTGSAAPAPGTMSGSADAVVAGTGQADAPPAATSGGAQATIGATGSVTTASAVVAGTGSATPPVVGAGQAAAAPAVVVGIGSVAVGGDGAIVTPTVIITGAGAVIITGDGQLLAPPASAATDMGRYVWPPRAGTVIVRRVVIRTSISVT